MSDHETSRAHDKVTDGPGCHQLGCGRHFEIRPPYASELSVGGKVRDHDEQRGNKRDEECPEAACDVGDRDPAAPRTQHVVPEERQDDEEVEVFQQNHGGCREACGGVPLEPPASAWVSLVDQPPREEDREGNEDFDLGEIEQARVERYATTVKTGTRDGAQRVVKYGRSATSAKAEKPIQ